MDFPKFSIFILIHLECINNWLIFCLSACVNQLVVSFQLFSNQNAWRRKSINFDDRKSFNSYSLFTRECAINNKKLENSIKMTKKKESSEHSPYSLCVFFSLSLFRVHTLFDGLLQCWCLQRGEAFYVVEWLFAFHVWCRNCLEIFDQQTFTQTEKTRSYEKVLTSDFSASINFQTILNSFPFSASSTGSTDVNLNTCFTLMEQFSFVHWFWLAFLFLFECDIR